jgi:hypothetical protein
MCTARNSGKTKSDVTFSFATESIVEVNPHGEQVGTEGAHTEAVELG